MSRLGVALRAETQRHLAILVAYPIDSIAWLAMTCLLFLALVTLLDGASGGTYGREGQVLTMVGWLTFQIGGGYIDHLSRSVSDEAESGTLEQISLSPTPLTLVFVARSIVYLVIASVRGIIAAMILALVVGVLPINASLISLFLASLPGACGLGLALAGLALVFKRTKALTGLVFGLMIFLTGAFVGLEKIGWLFTATRLLIPLTWGISLMRATLTDNVTLSALWRGGELIGLLVHSTVHLTIGMVAFAWGYRTARHRGTLAHY
jgi:ABC-2 type transport system permease protein